MKKRYLVLGLATFMLVGCTTNQPSSSGEPQSSLPSDSINNSTSESSQDPITSESTSNSSTSNDPVTSNPITSGDSSSQDSSDSSSSESGQGGETSSSELYQATIKNNTPEGYYESVRGLKGPELKEALHKIIDGHTHFGYSETQPYYKDVDRDPHDPNKMYFIYTGSTNVGTGYNKEHVWAKSHGKFEGKYPMHSDMHNLHPCNSRINSTRGNKDFAEGGKLLTDYNGNNRVGDTFEPSDFSKGDTARTIFYMATRYEGDNGEMDLEVEGDIASNFYDFTSGADGVHGNFKYLYEWATSGIDPVDDYEVSRNNKIYSDYQHNRNPFIDHPEFIEMIYDKNYSGPGALIDNNPHHVKTPEEEASDFIKLVDAIDETKIEANVSIEKAETTYSKMTNEAKDLVVDKYQELLTKKASYQEMSKTYWSNKVIEMIDNLGTITLDSKDAIEKVEKAYNDLSTEGKALVSNYQTLVDARATYDRLLQEWQEAHPSIPFVFDFTSAQGGTGSYKQNVTLTDGNRSFLASYCYQNGGEFRLGKNKDATVDQKFKSAINELEGHSASLESLFDISAQSISIKTSKEYGMIYNIYLLKSTDQGNTWTLLETKEYNKNTKIYEFNVDASLGRYAIVIDGSQPRLAIDSLEVK